MLGIVVAMLALPCGALAQTTTSPGSTISEPSSSSAGAPVLAPAPAIDKARAIRIARTDPKVAEQRRKYGPLTATAEGKPGTWQADFYEGGIERVQVVVDSPTGQILESWTGYQIAWQMARGNSGQFGHKLNAPYVWLPLAAIFLLGLFDFRRRSRVAHLDLLVLLSFGISE
ncbi:MAG: hypothetical protein ACRDK1_08440, partial [Solirubrobacterales bacterium]